MDNQEEKKERGTREKERTSARECGECVHYNACSAWNIGSLLHTDAAEVLRMYQYGIPGEVPPHSFDLNDETVEIILAALDERKRALNRLCEWCGVGCSMDKRRAELCEIAAVGKEFEEG